MLTIGTVAKSARVGVETLRYYERRGLLSSAPASRTFGAWNVASRD